MKPSALIPTPSQAAFFVMLDKAPYLKGLFDIETLVYHHDAAIQYLASASHGQAIMARFFLGVWQKNDNFPFDFFDAMETLDSANRQVIIDWMKNPFWP